MTASTRIAETYRSTVHTYTFSTGREKIILKVILVPSTKSEDKTRKEAKVKFSKA
jgi:hypothetical protein